MEDQVRRVIEQIRPAVQMDGGDVEFVSADVATGIVTIRFQGACIGCPMSSVTLHAGIAQELKQKVPAVKEVVALEDDAA